MFDQHLARHNMFGQRNNARPRLSAEDTRPTLQRMLPHCRSGHMCALLAFIPVLLHAEIVRQSFEDGEQAKLSRREKEREAKLSVYSVTYNAGNQAYINDLNPLNLLNRVVRGGESPCKKESIEDERALFDDLLDKAVVSEADVVILGLQEYRNFCEGPFAWWRNATNTRSDEGRMYTP